MIGTVTNQTEKRLNNPLDFTDILTLHVALNRGGVVQLPSLHHRERIILNSLSHLHNCAFGETHPSLE